jgi:hypothetical protein
MIQASYAIVPDFFNGLLGVLEDGMEHQAQTLLALSVSSGLCLAAWIWARRRLTRFSGERR